MGAIGLYTKIQHFISIPNFILYKSVLMRKCKEGKKAFNSRWDELKRAGYLKIYRMHGEASNQFIYEYELLDIADHSTPAVSNIGFDKKEDLLPAITHIPHLGGGGKGIVSDGEVLQTGGTINKNLHSKPIRNNTRSINQDEGWNELQQREMCRELIAENVEYDSFSSMEQLHISSEVLEGWLMMMVNTIFSLSESFLINDQRVYQSVLASEFKKVRRQHLIYAIDKYRSVEETIRNPEAYMRACLWSAIHNQGVTSDHAMKKMGVY